MFIRVVDKIPMKFDAYTLCSDAIYPILYQNIIITPARHFLSGLVISRITWLCKYDTLLLVKSKK